MKHPSIPPAAPAVLELSPYQSARMLTAFDPSKIYLDANELPLAPPETPIDFSEMHHYAHSGPRTMISAYADYAGISSDHVIATRGIDEGIDLLIRAYLEPYRDEIMVMSPTYGMYAVCAATHRVKAMDVPLIQSGEPDMDVLKRLDTPPKVIFLCRPNNPTGAIMTRESVEAILALTKGRSIVAVDEAYIEFCPAETLTPLLDHYPHLVILRTLSKGFGLAGIHTGFLLAHREIVDTINRIANPYPIPEPCAQIAIDALSPSGISRLQHWVHEVNNTKDHLFQALSSHPACINVLPSSTNFLLSQWKAPEELLTMLKANSILPRPVMLPGETQPRIRISIGTPEQVEQLMTILTL